MNICIRHYIAMCRVCHGAPGYALSEIAQGLYPEPPTLTSKDVQELTDAQLYWIMKNGIKMTGMPAFGKTHQEEDLLGMLALVRRLPTIQHEDYDAMLEAAGQRGGGQERDHHGSPMSEKKAQKSESLKEHSH
ncbi:MAG: cytochrome c [Deltaproteobacteria bacterium]|nr:cytochrome c [Deltaproteobacteria bacterium]MBW2307626.1 cytochrome c [Deltaproteobacteria bacterium]